MRMYVRACWGTCSLLAVNTTCRGSVTVCTDTVFDLDIAHVSTSDSSISLSAKTNPKSRETSIYLFFALAAAVNLASEELVLIASAAAVTFTALHCMVIDCLLPVINHLHMRNVESKRENWSAKTGPAGPLATAMLQQG